MSRRKAVRTPMVRERYAVILLTREAAATSVDSPPPDLGVPAAWVTCEVQRALVLRYVAGDGQNLPAGSQGPGDVGRVGEGTGMGARSAGGSRVAGSG